MKRINHWSTKHLSSADKEILIKSIAQAIPTYCMSVFLLPSTLEDELHKMMNSFWWSSTKQPRRGINWLNWDKLSMKEFGGTGFRHLHAFNLGWRLLTNQDTTFIKVFKEKYFPHVNFLR